MTTINIGPAGVIMAEDPSDAMVEAACEAHYGNKAWEDMTPGSRVALRKTMRRAIKAAFAKRLEEMGMKE